MTITRSPLVSVALIAYNLEKFIAEAIESVLLQTCRDLELIVVNNGSTDRTREIIDSFNDPRIIAIHEAVNQGPSVAFNRAFALCRGKYVALMSGDDVCHPERLSLQAEEYEKGPRGMLFSLVDFIDDDSRPLSGGHFAERYFEPVNLSQPQVLERFFFRGNFFNAITAFAERCVYDREPFDPMLYQFQDLDMWIRLVKKFPFRVMPQKLLKYRIRAGNKNLSCPETNKHIRAVSEHFLMMKKFFACVPAELFRAGFAKHLLRPDFQGDVEYACERAFLFFHSEPLLNKLIGIDMLYQLLGDEPSAAVLHEKYRFTQSSFAEALTSINVTRVPTPRKKWQGLHKLPARFIEVMRQEGIAMAFSRIWGTLARTFTRSGVKSP